MSYADIIMTTNSISESRSVVQFRLEEAKMKSLVEAAARKNTSPGVLARLWTVERLEQDEHIGMYIGNDLRRLKELEDALFLDLGKYLARPLKLIEKLCALYNQLGAQISVSKTNLDWKIFHAFISCIHGSHYQLMQATNSLLRGHRTDSTMYTRKALEFAAFGLQILVDASSTASEQSQAKSLAEIWLEAPQSNTAFDKYKTQFAITKAIKAAASFMDKIEERYDELSKQVHPSFFAVAGQSAVQEIDGKVVLLFDPFEVSDKRRLDLIAFTLFQIIAIHRDTNNAFAQAFTATGSSFDQNSWNHSINLIDQQFSNEKNAWAGTLDPSGRYRTPDLKLKAKTSKTARRGSSVTS